MNEATRLMNLLVAICGDQIRDYRPQLEALARKLAKTGGSHDQRRNQRRGQDCARPRRPTKAMDRLKRDGALSREAIRRRLQWVAYDRKLAPAEITKAMRTRNIVAFCKKHGVSLDWVLYGNLQDHPKKSWERKTVLTPDELRRAYESLGENDKAFISQYLSLLTKKDDAS